jgi:hypothetical protein
VSIPAVRKSPDIAEYGVLSLAVPNNIHPGQTGAGVAFGANVDTNPQPYVEVPPSDPRFPAAQAAATARLAILHTGVNPNVTTNGATAVALSRYSDPGETEDILDPAVTAQPVCHPVPTPIPPQSTGGSLNYEPIPGHPHWVVTDTTQPPGDWAPRRPDWQSVLVDQQPSESGTECGGNSQAQAGAKTDSDTAVELLQSVSLAPAQGYLTTPVPFGLWQQKPGCHFSSVPTVATISASQRPLWMNLSKGLSPSAPVYMSTPGEAVFKMICINCHGPRADSNGRLAQNLAIMTGGLDEVADFRDGLFGPVGSTPDTSNIHRVFGIPLQASGWASATDDDRAARYMAWMALGGTDVHIPTGILQIVSLTQVLDQHRILGSAGLSANMLSTAKTVCSALFGAEQFEAKDFNPSNPTQYARELIHSNGDAELWLHLCSLDNPPPIHVIFAPSSPEGVDIAFDSDLNFAPNPSGYALLKPESYPAGAPVGDDRGRTVPYVANNTNNAADPSAVPNLWPWCVYDPVKAQANNWPACPASVLAKDIYGVDASAYTADDAEKWSVRGAINAGLGVFLYVNSLETQNPPPDYNQCEQLK